MLSGAPVSAGRGKNTVRALCICLHHFFFFTLTWIRIIRTILWRLFKFLAKNEGEDIPFVQQHFCKFCLACVGYS